MGCPVPTARVWGCTSSGIHRGASRNFQKGSKSEGLQGKVPQKFKQNVKTTLHIVTTSLLVVCIPYFLCRHKIKGHNETGVRVPPLGRPRLPQPKTATEFVQHVSSPLAASIACRAELF